MLKKKIRALISTAAALILCLQGFAAAFDEGRLEHFERHRDYWSASWISGMQDDIRALSESLSISPEIDELLELYLAHSLYELSREQAIAAMLRRFLQEHDAAHLVGGALLRAFDPFGQYFRQADAAGIFSNAFLGFGFHLTGRDFIGGHWYGIKLRAVFSGSPASAAGFQAGDEFIMINGVNVEGVGLPAVSNLISSIEDEGRAYFAVRRGEEIFEAGLIRGTVMVPALTFSSLDGNTGLVAIENFSDFYMVWDFYEHLHYMEHRGYENLIIDLRGNGGGGMFTMAMMLDMLVPDAGVVLYSTKRRTGERDFMLSLGDGFEFERIIMLVDERTASAAELFAQSLREITGAQIIGSRTLGKGLGQQVFDLSNGDAAFITTFEAFSSEGFTHHETGVEPDIIAGPELVNIERGRLEQLNFVNSARIAPGADNNAVLALNQRLAAIGYIPPENATSYVTDMTLTAVSIFQVFYGLPEGLHEIDYRFIDLLNRRAAAAPARYEPNDAVLDRALEYLLED